jgi:hypothetical protein
VSWFDNFCVLLRRDGHSQLVYKHAISTIMPGQPVHLMETETTEAYGNSSGYRRARKHRQRTAGDPGARAKCARIWCSCRNSNARGARARSACSPAPK